MVYKILQQHDLCDYYNLNQNPGLNQRIRVRKDKFAFLDDANVQGKLINYQDGKEVHVTFYLPQMHCSSCLYLLEQLHRIEGGVVSSKVNFTNKEVDIVYNPAETSLRSVVEVLTSIGYEPYISLNDLNDRRARPDKSLVYQLGVAGFCFGNVMLMSFPEYLGIDASEAALQKFFRWFNLLLSLPVFFYSALPFYQSSWKSLKHRFLNIDAPIALAIIMTFGRSVYEVVTGTGSGYFDSMTGIVFFMLAGRWLQDKTYRQLSFDRDYRSYFPIAVSVLKDEREVPTPLPDVKPGDTLVIHNEELIPADGILSRGKAYIDYSFVTGESIPVLKDTGELLYAGGKQKGQRIELLVIREVAQSYLTRLWNRDEPAARANAQSSFVHLVSRYFTLALITIATITAIYWQQHDPSRTWPAVTAIFIIACPCALLLSNTFTNGNVIRILGRNGFYLRNAAVIEKFATIDEVIFDKTGTLTMAQDQQVTYEGLPLNNAQWEQVGSLTSCSMHPLSRAITRSLSDYRRRSVAGYREVIGKGIEGFVGDDLVRVGSATFTGAKRANDGSAVYVAFEDRVMGRFVFRNSYREGMEPLLKRMSKSYRLSVVSGDGDAERGYLEGILGGRAMLLFRQQPDDKLEFVKRVQKGGAKVMMIGDGLNDGAALRQSDIGIAVSDQANNFTPSSDAIIEAAKLTKLDRFIRLCKANKRIVVASFIISILYNIVGLGFAVQGTLSPLIAAILMPASSLSIFLLTFGGSNLLARRLGL